MIIEGIINVCFIFVNFLINLLPYNVDTTTGSLSSFLDLLGFGIYVIGPGPFVLIIGSIITWFIIHISWAVIEWIYKKIPGIS